MFAVARVSKSSTKVSVAINRERTEQKEQIAQAQERMLNSVQFNEELKKLWWRTCMDVSH